MSEAIKNRAETVIARTYNRLPLVFVRGEGCTLWDAEGKSYTDFLAGIAVCSLGHAHPDVTEAICRQAGQLVHVSNLFYTVPQIELAARLVENSFADRVFFCNSGAEANEAAIKLARKYFAVKGETRRYRIISMKQSFHGRTLGALAATGQRKIQEGYEPLLPGFTYIPYNDARALAESMSPEVCAVMLEPIQGEGGIICPSPGYLAEVRRICDEHGALLIYDEVQTGMGRTGRLFAYEHSGVRPDIMTLAKALGNGLPVGAMLATEQAAAAFTHGSHATTFGGSPVVCAAALAVLKCIQRDNLLEKCRLTGQYFKDRLMSLKDKHAVVKDVRGLGLLLGMELAREGAPVVRACLEKGYIINCIQNNVLRFAPPLIVSTTAVDDLIACLDRVLAEAP
jgi:acetylornithine aminotransferase